MAKLDEMITGLQVTELNKIATIRANDEAKARGYFPYHKFKVKDCKVLFEQFDCLKRMYTSIFATSKIIKKHQASRAYGTKITGEQFAKLDHYIKNTLKMDSWGVAQFTEKEIYKGCGIPYRNVIVMSMHMDKERFLSDTFPDAACLMEVYGAYADTGTAAIEVTKLLRDFGFGAAPNHSVGGSIDYTKAGYKANMGFIGRHGLLITPECGPCNRIAVVYTSVENLSDFLETSDHSWGKEFCKKCGKCVKTCPNQAIYEEEITDEHGHVTCISNAKCNTEFAWYACGHCVSNCPFTTVGYDRIKSKFKK
ncbi:MAG: 4Fe-4S binding protein [Bacillota bacterium]